ncbi:MAG: haloacid dehalogenase [Acidimicrobiia bacterium]
MTRPDLGPLAGVVRADLDDKFSAREAAVTNSRRVIRLSANAIRAQHRGESGRAEELMREAEKLLRQTEEILSGHPDIYHAGFVRDAAKEYAEARLTSALAAGESLPLPEDLGIDVVPYLNGLGEAVGELRRRMLDLLRQEQMETASAMLDAMEAVYELLADLDYPDGMTGGLRRTTDVARSLIERSRADLTTAIVQERLRRDLAESSD